MLHIGVEPGGGSVFAPSCVCDGKRESVSLSLNDKRRQRVCSICVRVCLCVLQRERGDYLAVVVGGKYEQERMNKNERECRSM